MKVITFEGEAYRSLARKIDRIFAYVQQQEEKNAQTQPDPSGIWVDNDEAATLLEISKRTLQRLRTAGEITYSIRGGRVRYTLAEVQRLVAGRIVPGKYRQEAELIEAHQEYHKRRKAKITNQ